MTDTRSNFSRGFNNATAAAVRGGRIVRAGAEFTVSAANATRGSTGVQGVRNHADAVVKYRRLRTEVGFGQESKLEAGLYGLAGDTLTVTGLALSAIALPKMASQAATSYQELKTLVRDPNADPEARLNAIEKLSRSSAGTVFAAQGVVVGTKGTYGILGRMPLFGKLFAKVGESAPLMAVSNAFGKFFKVVLPVADFAVLVGEGIAFRRVFNDPAATGGQKFKALVNLSLATLKATFWLFPQVRFLKVAYNFASFAQLSLALWDLKATMAPHFKQAATNVVWAIGHPVEATKVVGTKIKEGASWLAQGTLKVLGGVAKAVLNPIDTFNAVKTELGAWTQAYREGLQARTARAWYFLPWNQRPAGPAPAMPAPGALVPPPGAEATPQAVAPVAPTPHADPAAQAPVAPMPYADPAAQVPALPPVAPALPEALPPTPPAPALPELPAAQAPVPPAPPPAPAPEAIAPAPFAPAPIAPAAVAPAATPWEVQLG